MPSLRFATAADLAEAFPAARGDVGSPFTRMGPLDFLAGLVNGGNQLGAVAFCAYLLPRRNAVTWLCDCLRPTAGDTDHALAASEAWVRRPDDQTRRQALSVGMGSDPVDTTTWAALAAGWAGGSLAPATQPHVPIPEYLTPRAIRTAALLATFRLDRTVRVRALDAWIERGVAAVRIAAGKA